jgi:outer membrane protein assembly factor BamB
MVVTKRFLLAVVVLAAVAGTIQAADWPQFRGLNRDGQSGETGLLQAWPEGGPTVVWTNSEIGFGYSSIAVVKGRVYTSGNVGEEFAVTALDATGKKLWQQPLDKAVKNASSGARSTPTVDGEMIFVLSDSGTVFALKTADGAKVWSVNLREKFAAKAPGWAYAESLLVDGDRVYVCPGGKAAMAALNKKTGEEIWTSPAFEGVTYASPVLMPLGKLKTVVTFTNSSVFGVNAASGQKLWSYPVAQPWKWNATSAVFRETIVYATTCAGVGGAAVSLTTSEDGTVTATKVWTNPAPDDQNGGVVLVDGRIYGTGQNHHVLTAVDFKTGETVFTNKAVGTSSVIYADGRLYCGNQSGEVCLCDPKAEGKIVSKFAIALTTKAGMYAHPAISDGKLYVRHDGAVTVYEIKAGAEKK